MAAQSGSRPGRMLALGLALIALLFVIMFATDNKTPQLGLDLRADGTAEPADGSRAERQSASLCCAALRMAVPQSRQ